MVDVDEDYPPVDIVKPSLLDLSGIHESVVKLSFSSGGKPAIGSGFFISIPDSPYEVILTAGHNLCKSKTLSTNVTVQLPTNAISIPADRIKVSADYLNNPDNKEADYGVILIPYSGKRPRRGFGFNMIYAFSELRGEVHVSSYRDATAPGRPVLSTGLVKESTENQLVYEAKTEQGNSGAPVWIGYSAEDVAVVAVHNNAPAAGSTGSRGSRLSPKLLREVFSWAGLNMAKKIKAQNISKQNPMPPPPEGLYMIVGDRPFARLRRGTGTEFDVIPAQVTQRTGNIRYVLGLGGKWVMFDTDTQQAVLVDKPREQSLFTQQVASRLKPDIVYIILDEKHRLRMDGSTFRPYDLPDAQTSGVTMISGKLVPFVHFQFEPYTPFKPLPTAVDDSQEARCSACGRELPSKP